MLRTIELNRKLAEDTDLLLSYYANEGYSLTESGYWVKNLKDIPSKIQNGDMITAKIDIRTLDGKQHYNKLNIIEAGKDCDIGVISEVICKMNKGDSVSLIIPWYLAYGSTGNEDIAPYSNLKVEIILMQ